MKIYIKPFKGGLADIWEYKSKLNRCCDCVNNTPPDTMCDLTLSCNYTIVKVVAGEDYTNLIVCSKWRPKCEIDIQ